MTTVGSISVTSRDGRETQAFGERLGRLGEAGAVILLHGDLGAGKTTLTQGIAAGLGITEPVQSPTFTLVAEHDGHDRAGAPLRLYHLDLYRLTDPGELDSFGFEEYLAPREGLTVIEWPERAGSHLPASYLLVRLETTGDDQRQITVDAVPDDGPYAAWVAALRPS